MSDVEFAVEWADIDRCANWRDDEAWLTQAWDQAQVVLVHDGQTLMCDDDIVLWSSDEAPVGESYFLGMAAEKPYFAVAVAKLPEMAGTKPAGLRQILEVAPPISAALVVQAIGLERWHSHHPYCARCGARTELAFSGYLRRCPTCQAAHYPRVDPAVIMLVQDDAGRALLGRGVGWPQGRFSTLAGFVEPGESLEQAVAREVHEEVGLKVVSTRYFGSQPWPFPSSLMVGFIATVRPDDELRIDPVEIAEAYWFTRDKFLQDRRSGDISSSSNISISHALVQQWLDSEI